jgi:hypothetical protein
MSFTVSFTEDDEDYRVNLEPLVMSNFASHMMQAVSGNNTMRSAVVRNESPDVLSRMLDGMFRPASHGVKVPTFKCEADLGDCSICFDTIRKGQMMCRLPCKNEVSHAFHKKCIEPWLKTNNTCPNCRSKIR